MPDESKAAILDKLAEIEQEIRREMATMTLISHELRHALVQEAEEASQMEDPQT